MDRPPQAQDIAGGWGGKLDDSAILAMHEPWSWDSQAPPSPAWEGFISQCWLALIIRAMYLALITWTGACTLVSISSKRDPASRSEVHAPPKNQGRKRELPSPPSTRSSPLPAASDFPSGQAHHGGFAQAHGPSRQVHFPVPGAKFFSRS